MNDTPIVRIHLRQLHRITPALHLFGRIQRLLFQLGRRIAFAPVVVAATLTAFPRLTARLLFPVLFLILTRSTRFPLALRIAVDVQQNVRAILVVLEHDPVEQQLKAFQRLPLAADDPARIIRSDLHRQPVPLFLNAERGIEPEVIKHGGQRFDDLFLLLLELLVV